MGLGAEIDVCLTPTSYCLWSNSSVTSRHVTSAGVYDICIGLEVEVGENGILFLCYFRVVNCQGQRRLTLGLYYG